MKLLAPLAAALLSGCVYLNGVYNAERAYADAERARLAGRDSAAAALYAHAERKAERSYDAEPEGGWAEQAMYLVGRARLRQGDFAGARVALEPVRAAARDPELRIGAALYLGAVAVATGDEDAATRLLSEALVALPPGPLRAEGHLWRARLFLSMGVIDQGWWDLQRAGDEDPRVRVPSALERLTWGVVQADSARAVEGAEALLLVPAGAQRVDSLVKLAEVEADMRSPGAGAALLAAVDRTTWDAPARDRVLLARAALHARAGDTAAAVAAALRVADGLGSPEGAVAARLFVARLALASAQTVEIVDELRAVLLPVERDAAARRLLEAAGEVELLSERGAAGLPLGLFAAAEIARDRLGSPALATALFVAYADAAPSALWRGKALLAAVAATADPIRREELRRRALDLAGDPYVTVALGGTGDPAVYETLERGLRDELAVLLAAVTAEAGRRDVLVRSPQDTTAGGIR